MRTLLQRFISRSLRSNSVTSNFLGCAALQKFDDSYLLNSGWFNSFRTRLPVDANNEPLPWYTFPAIEFLKHRVTATMQVFEYGSGNSTLWWAKRVRSVVSCEHDRQWFDLISRRVPNNVLCLHRELSSSDSYERTAAMQAQAFDVMIIDGRKRVECIKNSADVLAENGVVIWDNSDRSKYQAGFGFLAELGFRRIDFTGLGPINVYSWCTSVFYRNTNCLGI